jgi:hypothetical protein
MHLVLKLHWALLAWEAHHSEQHSRFVDQIVVTSAIVAAAVEAAA